MQIPSQEQFNQWPMAQKLLWLNYETEGRLPPAGYDGFLFYPEQRMGIRYHTDRKSRITGARAMPIHELARMLIEYDRSISSLFTTQPN